MLKSLSTSLILRGILALAVGVMALAWPGITVLALVVMFAVYAFMASGLEAMRAFGSRTAGPVLGHILVGLIDLAAGVVALAWPGPTALVLVLIVASWAVVGGLVEVSAAFRTGEPPAPRRSSSSAAWSRSPSAQCCSRTRESARSPWRCCSACSTLSSGLAR